MPIYTVQAPDGRSFDLEGDSPPTEQELESVFASLPEPTRTPNRGGVGVNLSREDAKKVAAQRLVNRERAAGFRPGDLATRVELQALADEAGIPLGDLQGEVASTQTLGDPRLQALVLTREAASQAGFGVPGAVGRVLEDLTLNDALKSVVGSQALKQKAQEADILGGVIGQSLPSGLISNAATAPLSLGQRLLAGTKTGALIGGTAAGSGAVEQGGLTQPISNILAQAGVGAGTGAVLGGGLQAASPLVQSLSRVLGQSAEKNVAQALQPTTQETKAATERITSEILGRPFTETFAFTQRGLQEKSQAQRELAGEAINAFGKLTGETNPQQISTALEALKTPYIVQGKVIDQAAVDRIDEMKGVFDQFGNSIPREALRDIRRVFDKQIKESKGFFKDIKQGTELELKKVAADTIRETLAAEVPDLAKLNQQYTFWANLDNVISKTVERTKPQQGFTANVATIAGAATGTGLTDIALRALLFRNLSKAVQSPGWKLASARTKNAISNSLTEADPQKFLTALSKASPDIAREAGVELEELKTTP